MASARARALGTIEILELILLHLPPGPLLLAQRICSTWASVIRSSVPLQRRLYLAPLAEKLRITDQPPFGIPTVNPFIAAAFSRQIDRHSKPMRWVTAQGEHCIVFLVRIVSEEWPEAFKYPEASWRKMLLTQPPVTAASVQNLASYFATRGVAQFEARNEEGVRLAEVVYPR